MEAFSRFTDKSTGVNPFVLPPFRPSVSLLLARIPLVLLKTPLILLLLFTFQLSLILTNVVPILFFKRIIRNSIEKGASRILLFLIGVVTLQEEVVKPQLLRSEESKKKLPLPFSPSDIIIVNKSSYLDVLVLNALYAPSFSQINKNGNLEEVSFWNCLLQQVNFVPENDVNIYGHTLDANKLTKFLQTRKKSAYGPLVIFPESVPSNNLAILRFDDFFHTLSSVLSSEESLDFISTRIVALKYSTDPIVLQSQPSLPLVYGNTFVHFFWLLGSTGGSKVTSYRPPIGFDLQSSDFPLPKQSTLPPGVGDNVVKRSWPDAVSEIMVQLMRGGCRRVESGVKEYLEFVNFYRTLRSGTEK
jgi:1-acyl-sn-glycerol-3-phosphate acyltransferase